MTRIANNHSSPLGLPDGTVLPAGAATSVQGWDKLKGNAVVKAWLERGILSVITAEYVEVATFDEPEPDHIPANEAAQDEKSALQAKLDDAGIAYDNRWGVKKLRAALEG